MLTYSFFYVVPEGLDILKIDAVIALRLQKINGTSLHCFQTTQTPQGLSPDLYFWFSRFFDGKLDLAKNFVHKVRVREGVKPAAATLRRLPFTVREQDS